jgi:hypothetical protein
MASAGLTSNGTEIASGGIAGPPWSTIGGQRYAPDTIPQNLFSFYLCYGCETPATGNQGFNISYDITNNNIYNVILHPFTNSLAAGEPQLIQADVACNQAGKATTYWQIDFGAPYELIGFGFTYTCVMPLLDVWYNDPSQVVATQTVVAGSWMVNGSGGTEIADVETTSTFGIFLDAAQDPKQLPHQFYEVTFKYDPALMQIPTITDPNAGVAPYMSSSYQPIAVQWNCLASAYNTPVTMYIRYGWEWNVMAIKLTKDCTVYGNGGGGWSAAAIFFFTLFMLILFLCISGCAWNYWKEDRRGWQIIPLYETTVNCVEKVRGTDKKWTPQMDTSSTGRGGTYGSDYDSGHSYQSNL